ncbi:unnamed protein product [Moneuplotes crassus]|uniref:Uncharacterized protein n=1 Tax=Euplotes crassus TaxID=5936 RepID=A0AAD2CYF4_EUPCR|nr:unnamed protein product [Moneuplotes crassus]
MSKITLKYNERGFINSKSRRQSQEPDFEEFEEEQIPKINMFPEGLMKRKPSIRDCSLFSEPYNNQWKLKLRFKKEDPFCEFGSKGKPRNKVRNTKMKPNSMSPECRGVKKESCFTNEAKKLKENQHPKDRMRIISIGNNCIMPKVLVCAKNRSFAVCQPDQYDTMHNCGGKPKCFNKASPALESHDSNIPSKRGTPYFKNPKIEPPYPRKGIFSKKASTSLREINYSDNRENQFHILRALRSALNMQKHTNSIHNRSIINPKPHENIQRGYL